MSQGQTLTRQNCVVLFYNLLTAENSEGVIYGTTLGYTITNGEVDYSNMVSSGTKGPYVATSSQLSLPFGTENVTVYRNGALSSLSTVSQYDVYYYNENLRTVWIYSNRVTGTLTAISPSTAAPTSVTVAGNTYELGTSSVTYKFSSQGSFTDGDPVTLLLGMNGEVVDAISAEEGNALYYGVVLSSTKGAAEDSTTSSDTTSVQTTTQVACSDGTVRTFYHSGYSYGAGRLVSVTVNSGGTTIKNLSTRSLTGTVNKTGTTFAGYTFADDVEILDTDDEGGYTAIYPSRLAGATLSTGDVRYYTLDENGEIDRLILHEVTGDTLTYVYLISASSDVDGMNVSGTYTYLLDGQSQTITGSIAYDIRTGGAILLYEDGSLRNLSQLESVTLTQLSDLYAMADGQKYLLDDEVQVLLRDTDTSGGYYVTTLSEINDTDYTLKGWYDDLGYSAGGRIRIIVATAK